MTTQRIHRLIAIVGFLLTVPATAPVGAAELPATDPPPSATADAYLLSYEINRARWDPATFEERAGDVSLPISVFPAPPLAMNNLLAASASLKADELVEGDYFDHQSAVTGLWPNELARSFGYPLARSFADEANGIESLYAGSSDPLRVLSAFARSSSHRTHIFGVGSSFLVHSEIGVGRSSGANFWAVHTAYSDPDRRFVTGAVFDDHDGDGFMSRGEGIAGVVVSVAGVSTVTNDGGMYSIGVPTGPAEVKFEDGSILGSTVVDVGSYNVWVDQALGSDPIVRAFALCGSGRATILGTDGDDVLQATPNRDVIQGFGGDDRILDLGPDDVVCPVEDRLAGESTDSPVLRMGGSDRFDTAATVSRFSHPDGADVVYIATGENFPDALAVGPVAARAGAPILLVRADNVPGATATELQRLVPSRIYVVGGTSSVSTAVERQLERLVPDAVVERIAGRSRFETAVEVSRLGHDAGVGVTYVVNGFAFPDALVGAPVAFVNAGPILLVEPNRVPPAVERELERLGSRKIVIIGSTSSVSDAVATSLKRFADSVERISGHDRYATAVAMSRGAFDEGVTTVYIAVGTDYPDGLTGGAAVSWAVGPILLVGRDDLPSSVLEEIRRLSPGRIVILGGSAVVSPENELILRSLVGG